MVNMIFGGNEINGVTFSATKKTKVSITHSKRLRADYITFTGEDANRLLPPHNDALIISLNVLDFKIKRVLVDPESSLMNAEGVMKTTLFEVVDGDIRYNIILGRPWLHEMKVVPSMYQQFLKILTLEGIKQIRGDQPAAREMNAILVSSSKGKERAA
uniref:Uncharacterized protein LOC104241310 n=1 Tax=Nicotiana sylvestris TaxID=4096 RepID=A0A1U7Y6W5_NICSY|nr:PREDICTED: uncharacterized protein LOC104241310 [Nicotiana sylvestris]